MNPHNFFAELKRRNVYKGVIAYAIVGSLLVQVATQVFPFFEIPNWAVRAIVIDGAFYYARYNLALALELKGAIPDAERAPKNRSRLRSDPQRSRVSTTAHDQGAHWAVKIDDFHSRVA
jgi:hypothetical protein